MVINIENCCLVKEGLVPRVERAVARQLTSVERQDELEVLMRKRGDDLLSPWQEGVIRGRGIGARYHAVLPERLQDVLQPQRRAERVRIRMFMRDEQDGPRGLDKTPSGRRETGIYGCAEQLSQTRLRECRDG